MVVCIIFYAIIKVTKLHINLHLITLSCVVTEIDVWAQTCETIYVVVVHIHLDLQTLIVVACWHCLSLHQADVISCQQPINNGWSARHILVIWQSHVILSARHTPVTWQSHVILSARHIPVIWQSCVILSARHIPVTCNILSARYTPVTWQLHVILSARHIPVKCQSCVIFSTKHIPIICQSYVMSARLIPIICLVLNVTLNGFLPHEECDIVKQAYYSHMAIICNIVSQVYTNHMSVMCDIVSQVYPVTYQSCVILSAWIMTRILQDIPMIYNVSQKYKISCIIFSIKCDWKYCSQMSVIGDIVSQLYTSDMAATYDIVSQLYTSYMAVTCDIVCHLYTSHKAVTYDIVSQLYTSHKVVTYDIVSHLYTSYMLIACNVSPAYTSDMSIALFLARLFCHMQDMIFVIQAYTSQISAALQILSARHIPITCQLHVWYCQPGIPLYMSATIHILSARDALVIYIWQLHLMYIQPDR